MLRALRMSWAESDFVQEMNWIIVCAFRPSDHLCYFVVSAQLLGISLAAPTECTFVYSVIKKPNFKPILTGLLYFM